MYTGLFLSFLFYPNGLLVYVCKTLLFPLTSLMRQYLGSQPSVIELIRVYKSHLGNLDASVSLLTSLSKMLLGLMFAHHKISDCTQEKNILMCRSFIRSQILTW